MSKKAASNRKPIVSKASTLREIQTEILEAANLSREKLSAVTSKRTSFTLMHSLKFEKAGFDPLEKGRELNFIEQLNQMFTCLATLKATEKLLAMHPDKAPFALNLGTSQGSDVISADGSVAAEVFAATSPTSNDKLNKDIVKVGKQPAVHKYVFWYCPTYEGGVSGKSGDVTIIRLDSILMLPPLPTFDMGEALVDIADREALYEAMDGPELRKMYGTTKPE